jgi:dihydropteroate synthase
VIYHRPLAFLSGSAARQAIEEGSALPLAGGWLAFTLAERIERVPGQGRRSQLLPVAALDDETRHRLSRPRARFAGLDLSCPRLMGIVNVTADSFHALGRAPLPELAAAHARRLLEEGADLIDVGGESTRPGSAATLESVEIERVQPVVRGLAGRGALVSIDTRRPAVMQAALKAGARIVNDITALADPQSRRLVRDSGASAILMHMQGDPATMQDQPVYDDVLLDVFDFLQARIAACRADGIAQDRLAVDPGIGFGKTLAHNLALLDGLSIFHDLGVPILLGASRKSFIANLCGGIASEERLPGSLAASLKGAAQGAQIHRVHDVADNAQALRVWRPLC